MSKKKQWKPRCYEESKTESDDWCAKCMASDECPYVDIILMPEDVKSAHPNGAIWICSECAFAQCTKIGVVPPIDVCTTHKNHGAIWKVFVPEKLVEKED